MTTPSKPTCATCRYFEVGYFGDAHACRRYPPSISTGTGMEIPAVKRDDWCGEHRPMAQIIDPCMEKFVDRVASSRWCVCEAGGKVVFAGSKPEAEEWLRFCLANTTRSFFLQARPCA